MTVGATEALAAAVLGLCEPGDEVLMLEPHYDSYPPIVAMAGGTHRCVPLRPDATGRFALDVDELAAAVGPRTRLLILNTPHNPTGTVLTRDELAGSPRSPRHDLIVLTDEVYEYLVYDDAVHLPLGTFDGMAERTVTISSAGKTFNTTGWKIGWACGPAPLIAAVRAANSSSPTSAARRSSRPSPGHCTPRWPGSPAARQPAGQAGSALRGTRGGGFRGLPAAGHLLRDDRYPAARGRRRHAVLPRPAGQGRGGRGTGRGLP